MHSNDEGMGGESVSSEHAARGAKAATGMEAVEALTDAEVLSGTRRLVCQSNRALAALLAHLAEVEARGLHRTRACSSLYTYCIYELRMSEDAAYRRVAAARLVKRFPMLFGAIERGELHLTALLLVGPHLTEANVVEVGARAKFRTKKEVVKLVRLLSPLPDVPSRIEPLGLEAHRPAPRATWGNLLAARCPVRELQPDERPGSWLPPAEDNETAEQAETFAAVDDSASREPALARSAPAPDDSTAATSKQTAPAPARLERTTAHLDAPQRFKVQFTAGEEYVALVDEAKALLAHELPRADLAEIHLHALRTLVATLKKRKYATPTRRNKTKTAADSTNTAESPHDAQAAPARHHDEPPEPYSAHAPIDHPRQRDSELPPQRDANTPRHHDRYIPAAVRRAVFERDGNRCAYVDSRGERCRETSRLEFHHREPFARGGPTTFENLSLYCTAHNALAAEQDFGRELATSKREEHSHFAERIVALAGSR
jgi:hypothetical protein